MTMIQKTLFLLATKQLNAIVTDVDGMRISSGRLSRILGDKEKFRILVAGEVRNEFLFSQVDRVTIDQSEITIQLKI